MSPWLLCVGTVNRDQQNSLQSQSWIESKPDGNIFLFKRVDCRKRCKIIRSRQEAVVGANADFLVKINSSYFKYFF